MDPESGGNPVDFTVAITRRVSDLNDSAGEDSYWTLDRFITVDSIRYFKPVFSDSAA